MTLQSNIANDKFTEYVYQKYDIQDREQTIVEVPDFPFAQLEKFDWHIGIIMGRSGAGKSTILRTLEGNMPVAQAPVLDYGKAVVSQFPNLSEDEVCEMLCGIGLSSVPTWLRSPKLLSNGERARFDIVAEIANAKEGEVIVIDEFTSVVNRDVAKSMSYSLQRYVRKKGLRVIVASCHYDIIEWLQPNWIFNLNKQANGTCELEHLIYSGEKEYKFNKLRECEILSDERDLH